MRDKIGDVLLALMIGTIVFFVISHYNTQRAERNELRVEICEHLSPWLWWHIVGHNLVDGGSFVTLSDAITGVVIYDNITYGFGEADTATWIISPEDSGSATTAYGIEITDAKEKISHEWVGSLVIHIKNGYDAGGFLVARTIAVEELRKIGIEVE